MEGPYILAGDRDSAPGEIVMADGDHTEIVAGIKAYAGLDIQISKAVGSWGNAEVTTEEHGLANQMLTSEGLK